MKSKFAIFALSLLFVSAGPRSSPVGTWRQGFKFACEKAVTFNSWAALSDWAEAGQDSPAPAIRLGRSTDLMGGRHYYEDTRAGGYRDGRIIIFREMKFIGMMNTGGPKRFLEINSGLGSVAGS